jgi:penicillin-binding protein 1A
MTQSSFPGTRAEKIKKRIPVYRKILRWMWILAGIAAVGMAMVFYILSFQDLPTFEELENPKNKLASEVYSSNGELLGRYYLENRVLVAYEDLSPHLVNALVATEDERYYNHSGIDGWALMRVLFRTILMGDSSGGGGSTVTQQLAKLLYSDRNFSGMNKLQKILALASRKGKEWITAVKLERSYTKEEIISMYLNQFDFINGAYGIKAASEVYFGKSQDSLEIQEAAVLVGMLKNPSYFNPVRRPEITQQRREVVLKQMQKNEIISPAQYDSLRTLPLSLQFSWQTHNDGPAPYFRMVLRQRLKEILSQENHLKPDGTEYNIYSDGLKVYTTIDMDIQRHMEEAMIEHMPKLQERFWKRWKGKDPWTYRDAETTPEQLEIRERSLNTLIRRSDRYQAIYNQYLGDVSQSIRDQFEFDLRDYDIKRMLKDEEEGNRSFIGRMVSEEKIEPKKAAKYRAIMKSEYWRTLKKQWKAFEVAVDEAFEKEVPMKVFAYNKQMEKDTLMSPIDSLKYHRSFLQIGSMAVDPVTGYVRGWLGGINHKYFKYDHVTSSRQVGSTFKPFIYSTAIAMQAKSPCQEVPDVPQTIHKGEGNFGLLEDWTPSNANGKYSHQILTLKDALKKSVNTVSVYLMKELGDVEPVLNIVRNMGLGNSNIPPQPSICLGAADLSVQEMTGAYTTFANNGTYIEPVFVYRIEDRNGRVIYEANPVEKVALQPEVNYVMIEMLRHVMSGAYGFTGIKSDVGGKTGTTNDYVDGWFMGVTPELVVGTWVGGEDRWIRFFTLADGQGSVMARPYFANLLKRVEEDKNLTYNAETRFYRPPGDLGIVIDCNQYRLQRTTEEGTQQEDERFREDVFGDEFENEEEFSPRGLFGEEDGN